MTNTRKTGVDETTDGIRKTSVFLKHACVPVMLAFLLGLASLPGDFYFDDFQFVIKEDSQTWDWTPFPAIAGYEGAWSSSFSRKLVNLTMAWDFMRAGFDPAAFHLWNVVLHACCTFLVFGFTAGLCRHLRMQGYRTACLAAVCFAVHPIATETVAYTVGRFVLFSSMFSLASAWCLVEVLGRQSFDRSGAVYLCLAGLSWMLAAFCKEVGLLYPGLFALVLVFVFCAETIGRRGLLLGLLALLLLAGLVVFLIPNPGAVEQPGKLLDLLMRGKGRLMIDWDFDVASQGLAHGRFYSFRTHLFTQSRIIWKFLCLYLWPFNRLCIDREVLWSRGLFQPWHTFAAFSACVTLCVWALAGSRRTAPPGRRLCCTGVLLSIAGYLPYFVIPNAQVMVEYKFYLPLLGLGIIMAGLFEHALERMRFKRIVVWAGIAIIGAAWASYFVYRLREWQHPERIWHQAYARSTVWARPILVYSEVFSRMAMRHARSKQEKQQLLDKAVELVEEAVTRDAIYVHGLEQLGHLSFLQGKLDKSIACYRKVISFLPQRTFARTNLAGVLIQKGAHEEAQAHLLAVLRVEPANENARQYLAVSLYEQKRYAQAASWLQELIRENPNHARAHFYLARIFSENHQPARAKPHVEKALRLLPKEAEFHSQYGLVLCDLGDLAQGLDELTTAVRLDPDNAVARNNLALTLSDLGRYEEAETHYRAAIRAHPKGTAIYVNLANLLLKQDRPREAIRIYKQALEIDVDVAETHYNLAIALTRIHERDAAVAAYQRAIHLNPAHFGAHNNLGNLLLQSRKLEDAAAHFSEAIRLKPDYASAYNNLGVVRFHQGRLQEALAHYRKALSIQPDYRAAQENLKQLMRKMNAADREQGKPHPDKSIE